MAGFIAMSLPFNPPGAFSPPPPFNPPAPLRDLTPDLKAALKRRVELNLSGIILKLSPTVFYRESPALQPLREQAPFILSEPENNAVLPKFYSAVPFTSYDDYSPFVSRIIDKSPCQDRFWDFRREVKVFSQISASGLRAEPLGWS
ncbi:hypothetical protein GALMADRAFT_817611 [Galerina marginata CBS 339.88]|uniref:Uncharacterized protein n=1 Tax=Galerina marginata (strain CBS 339.88) TaxID=685588 RepID=A0A067TJ21_GALM3|nr:hypothetical protein GALMADRAFT_817611 [Galerina marginata CBS 339.88]